MLITTKLIKLNLNNIICHKIIWQIQPALSSLFTANHFCVFVNNIKISL